MTPKIEELEGIEAEVPCEVSHCYRKAQVLVMWAYHSKMTCKECSIELSDRDWLHVSTIFGHKPCLGSDGKVSIRSGPPTRGRVN